MIVQAQQQMAKEAATAAQSLSQSATQMYQAVRKQRETQFEE